ncbi:MAG: hypothetical protein Q4B58_01545, partial [Bacteroidales bacterium]|nr:hypothetical protein [Bacteroidales bacterium]
MLNLLVTNPSLSFEELYLEGDLTDYSHLNKEFHHFTNMTPREYLESLRKIQADNMLDVYQSYYDTQR